MAPVSPSSHFACELGTRGWAGVLLEPLAKYTCGAKMGILRLWG